MQNGQGIFTHPNGDFYRGEWMDGMPHGKGELLQITEYFKQAFGAEGNEGFELWANRSKYVGEFMFGDKHGDGKLVWQD